MKKFPFVILCCCFMLAFLQGCSSGGNTDVQFAKTAFEAMANNDPAAEQMVDWENFQALGQNIGTLYKSMPDETQKSAFRKAFLTSYSTSFKGAGASAESLTNWRVQSEDSGQTIIAADGQNAVILVTVSNGVVA